MFSVWVDRCQTIGLAHNSRKENISDNRSHERIKQTAHFGGVAFLARSLAKDSHRRWFEHTYSLMHQAWTADRFICESSSSWRTNESQKPYNSSQVYTPTSAQRSAADRQRSRPFLLLQNEAVLKEQNHSMPMPGPVASSALQFCG